MSDRKNPSIKFVGLHAHSTSGSPFDAIGYPPEHMDFAYDNGMDALALTDHGNMNGLAYQVLHAKKMKKSGRDFKPIYGVEAYFHPDLEEWFKLKEQLARDKKKAKEIGGDDASGATYEDEDTTKSKKSNPLNQRNHIVLLAQNQVGLNNLFSLVSKSFSQDYFYKFPRIDYKLLGAHCEGVIASSACLGGIYAGDYWRNIENGDEAVLDAMRETTRKMQKLFGKRWLAELQWIRHPDQHNMHRLMLQVADELNVPVISTCDSHYPNPEVWKDRALYKKLNPKFIAKEMKASLPSNIDEVGYELFPKNGEQMWEAYKHYSQFADFKYDDDIVRASIERTHEIAHEWIEDFVPDNTVRLPEFVIPEGKTADEALREMAEFELAKMGLDNDAEGSKKYMEQLDRELKVIAARGFSSYFLTMKQISDIAQEYVLTGPGRGSAAGALVSYVLGITQVDPLRWGLMFSRFLRADATDYPDIDYDVSDNSKAREEIIKRWGNTTAVSISNWVTLQPRSLISDIAKFYGVPFKEVKAVTAVMEKEATPKKKKKLGIKAGVLVGKDALNFDDLKEYSESLIAFLDKYPTVADHLDKLYGQVKACSRHAGGMVIGEELDRRMPLIRNGGVVQTPWSEGMNVRHLEPMGFIKFDLLALGTLRMLEDAIELILKRHHGVKDPTFEQIRDYYQTKMHSDTIDFEDQKVYEHVFHKGNWCGIFQFAENGMQHFAKQAKPRNLIDLTALTSIWRPGPMGANVHIDYVKARENVAQGRPIKYRHPALEPYLKETYGFLIFQEQIAQIACGLGKDITEDEGNKLRKILIKHGTGGDKVSESDKIYAKFVAGCKEKGISEKTASDIWDDMYAFKQYGFNKSHALSYSIISYQTAWMLTYYPVEWVCAFMNQQGEAKKEQAISIANSLGFDVKPVSVEESGIKWEPTEDGESLVQPLNTLTGMGDAAMKKVVQNRPFTSIDEMLFDKEKKIGKKALDVLIRAGACDYLMDERFNHRKHMWLACAYDKPTSKKKFLEKIELYKKEDDFSHEEIIENLVAITGVFPFEMIVDRKSQIRVEKEGLNAISEFDPKDEYVWFVPRKITRKKTQHGKEYWILDVVDVKGKNTKIRCWGVKPDDESRLKINRPYMASLDYNEKYGFSTRSIRRDFILIG